MVAEKLVETRKYYDMYNTLEESHRYMTQEVKLLESICESFPRALKSKGSQEEFLTKFGQIVVGVAQTQEQVESTLKAEREMRDMLLDKNNKLLDKQRKYFKVRVATLYIPSISIVRFLVALSPSLLCFASCFVSLFLCFVGVVICLLLQAVKEFQEECYKNEQLLAKAGEA